MDRTELPTEAKLATLRAAGVVPYSELSGRAAVALVLMAVLGGIGFKEQLSQCAQLAALSDLGSCTAPLWTGFIAPALVAALAVMLWGLIQTKFHFRFDLVTPNVARLLPWEKISSAGLLATPFKAIFWWAAVFGLGAVVFRQQFPATISVLTLRPEKVLAWWQMLWHHLSGSLVIGLVTLVALTVLAERAVFLFRHRMSREEILAEERGVS